MINEQNYAWSTHQPFIRAIMELYKPKYVLELGIGNYSTPVFLEYSTILKSIENDSDWINEIKSKYPEIDVTHHDAGVSQSEPLRRVSQPILNNIRRYYDSLEVPEISPKLLFVDQFSACRTISINALANKFDFVIFHDTHARDYRYDKITVKGFKRFELVTDKNSTGILIKDEIDISKFKAAVNKQIKRYKKENPECKKMKLC